jgi:hypothetical protein
MRFDPSLSSAATLGQLRAEAALRYGAGRLDELGPFLEAAASALFHLAQTPLDLMDEPADTLAARGPRG